MEGRAPVTGAAPHRSPTPSLGFFPAWVVAAAVAVTLAGGWGLVWATGGTPNVLAHTLYIPVVLAAMRFGSVGSGLTALAAGLLLGPLLPNAAGDDGWITRALFLLAIGQVVAVGSRLLADRLSRLEHTMEVVERNYERTLSAVAAMAEARDSATAGHCERVAYNVDLLARRVGVNGRLLHAAWWAGLLHDVGKISIPEHILNKPGRLDAEQTAIMRTHAAVGAELLLRFSPDFTVVAEAVRSHHERWDGSGYPDGLAGETIPLLGRIVAVCDVFEAMTEPRPYRAPLGEDEVMAHLHAGAGTQFDPALVAAFVALWESGARLRTPSESAAPYSITMTPTSSPSRR